MNNRLKIVLVVLIIPAIILGVWALNNAGAQANRTCVCHIEDKKANTGHVIEVDDNSLQGHLQHGDTQCTDCSNVGNPCSGTSGAACTE